MKVLEGTVNKEKVLKPSLVTVKLREGSFTALLLQQLGPGEALGPAAHAHPEVEAVVGAGGAGAAAVRGHLAHLVAGVGQPRHAHRVQGGQLLAPRAAEQPRQVANFRGVEVKLDIY